MFPEVIYTCLHSGLTKPHSYQASEVLDGEADSFLCGRVQGLLQKPSYGPKFQYLDSTYYNTLNYTQRSKEIQLIILPILFNVEM